MDRSDVLVVGARCAGAPLAMQLARAGKRVVVVDADEATQAAEKAKAAKSKRNEKTSDEATAAA